MNASATSAPADSESRLIVLWAFLGACGLAYGPLLAEHFANLWLKPHYQFYPFAVAAFAGLLVLRLREAVPRNDIAHGRTLSRGAVALAVMAWALLAGAYWGHSPWLAAVSAVVLVAAVIAQIQHVWVVPGLWAAWCVLWLVVPPPLNRDQVLIAYLQRVSSQLSSYVLDMIGVRHLMSGNVLTLGDRELFVDEACSGIISVMSLIACGLIYGAWRRRPPLHLIALIGAGVVWAVVTNVGRIVTIAVAWDWYQVDWTTGAVHEALSLGVFTFAFGGLASTDLLLALLLAPVGPRWAESTAEPLRFGGRLVAVWDACTQFRAMPPQGDAPAVTGKTDTERKPFTAPFGWGVVVAFALLAGVQVVFWSGLFGGGVVAKADRVPQALTLDESALPEEIGRLQRIDFEREDRERGDISGDHSLVYRYRDSAGNELVLSCSFPFYDKWHDLRVCYTGSGWTLGDHAVLARGDWPEGEGWEGHVTTFDRPEGLSAYVVYCYFDALGEPIDPPAVGLGAEALRSIRKRELENQFTQRFQVQVLAIGADGVDEELRAAARQLLAVGAREFREAICGVEDSSVAEKGRAGEGGS